MSRLYWGAYTGTYTNAGGNTDLWSIQAADDKPLKLRYFSVSQISEVGDAGEEGIQVTLQRLPATFTVGSGGSAVTPSPTDSADAAWGGTLRANDTTVATTSGTAVTLGAWGWNERAVLDVWFPDDRFCPKVKQTEGLILRADTTPADDLSICLTICLEEE